MEKPKKNYFIILILIFFILFLVLYISKEAGYYEYKAHQKTILTEEAIIKFEKDISEGKDVQVSDYLVVDNKEYYNRITSINSNIGSLIENFMNERLEKGIKILGVLFWN